MEKIRIIEEQDLPLLAEFEIEISKISFGDKAITDKDFYIRKLRESMTKDKNGMMVMEVDGQTAGWLWLEEKTNYLTKEKYVNFRSVYIIASLRGKGYAKLLLSHGMAYCKKVGATSLVSKVHFDNMAMRSAYSRMGFVHTHVTMEYHFTGDN